MVDLISLPVFITTYFSIRGAILNAVVQPRWTGLTTLFTTTGLFLPVLKHAPCGSQLKDESRRTLSTTITKPVTVSSTVISETWIQSICMQTPFPVTQLTSSRETFWWTTTTTR